MKKFILSMLAFFITAASFAQTAELQKVAAKYKNVASLTASARRTVHKTGGKDKVTEGTLYVKKSGRVMIANGKDAMIMNGTAFTTKKGALKAKTDSKKDNQFRSFQNLMEVIFGWSNADITRNTDVKAVKSGTNIIVTITPDTGKKKALFTSIIATIDTKSNELRSLRMNQKNGNYTDYVFSAYKLGANVNDSLFK